MTDPKRMELRTRIHELEREVLALRLRCVQLEDVVKQRDDTSAEPAALREIRGRMLMAQQPKVERAPHLTRCLCGRTPSFKNTDCENCGPLYGQPAASASDPGAQVERAERRVAEAEALSKLVDTASVVAGHMLGEMAAAQVGLAFAGMGLPKANPEKAALDASKAGAPVGLIGHFYSFSECSEPIPKAFSEESDL